MASADAQPTTVLLLEDHDMVATAFGNTIRAEDGLHLVGTAASIVEGKEAARRHAPDVIVSDLLLRDGSVLPHIGDLRTESGGARVLVVTGAPSITVAGDALGAGAAGFLAKTESMRTLLHAIHRIANGELVLATEYLPALIGSKEGGESNETLSTREIEVLQRLADGVSAGAVAAELGLSPNTIRNHLARIFTKLGVHSRLEAVAEAQRHGLIGGPGAR